MCEFGEKNAKKAPKFLYFKHMLHLFCLCELFEHGALNKGRKQTRGKRRPRGNTPAAPALETGEIESAVLFQVGVG